MSENNTDIIIMTEALKLVKKKLVNVMARAFQVCSGIQGPSNPWLYPFSAGTADYSWETGKPLADGSCV